ncbi:transporter [Sphingomonas hankookensis]|uniref:transporter n=1 Tax=Sphingomonas hankookensis TaxID=563996 RepID=UPI001F568EC2|nr:transporter [Sphingomonas hankookensis]
MKRLCAALLGMVAFVPVAASARDYCPTRPSLGQSACTLDTGRVAIETALSDWERDSDADTVLFGDTLFRLGLADRVELQVDWTPVGVVRDRATGGRTARSGDLEIGSRIALKSPDGKGLSYGLQPSVTVPVGRSPVGAGGWGAALVAPISYDLSNKLNLQFSPEIATMPREDRGGNMAVATATLGLGIAVSDKCQLTVEGQWSQDGMTTEHRAALAVAWQVSDDFFIDAGGVAGLDHDTPALRVYSGLSRRF